MNELIIKSKQLATIEFDKEKALQEANDLMSKYDGYTLTSEDVPDAKKLIATFRKVAKEYNSQALALDKELTNNVKVFRSDVKDVIKVIDNGVTKLDTQVKEFESQAKQQRKDEIMDWEEYKLISEFVPFNDEWLLKKWTDDKLKSLLTDHNEQLTTYVSTIKMTAKTLNLKPEFYIDKLKTTPYAQVIERMNEDAVNLTNTPEEVKPVIIDEDAQRLTITRVITGTHEQLKMLKKYALEIGCEYNA